MPVDELVSELPVVQKMIVRLSAGQGDTDWSVLRVGEFQIPGF